MESVNPSEMVLFEIRMTIRRKPSREVRLAKWNNLRTCKKIS